MAGDARTDDVNGVPALEERLADDEARLAADEARLAHDEARLAHDEARLEAEEAEVHENRIIAWFGVALALVLVVAMTALVLSVVALRDDVGTIRHYAGVDSVGTSAIRDDAVSADKIAPSAVGGEAIAAGAVGTDELAPDSVTGSRVAHDSLTGSDIRESTLHTVPAATSAQTADDSTHLGGLPARVYLSTVEDVSAATPTNASRFKGPLTARCPSGSRVISGGAKIHGAVSGAAIVSSAPEQGSAWTATARVVRNPAPSWQLVVTAVCAEGGQ